MNIIEKIELRIEALAQQHVSPNTHLEGTIYGLNMALSVLRSTPGLWLEEAQDLPSTVTICQPLPFEFLLINGRLFRLPQAKEEKW